MRHKSPSSSQPSAQLPAKQLTSPLLPLFAPSSAPRPASTSSSAGRAADGCLSPISYWDQPERTAWDFDNTIYCDSTGCSYDAKKNPCVARYAATVAEFDDCSYEEYEDTVFLCGQCNLKCLRKVNGSKIKSKMPIERFLAQRDSEDPSDSFSADALDLPKPPPVAADFPELPRAAPAPKMSKSEKAMADKISMLLLSSVKGTTLPPPPSRAPLMATLPASPQIEGNRNKKLPATEKVNSLPLSDVKGKHAPADPAPSMPVKATAKPVEAAPVRSPGPKTLMPVVPSLPGIIAIPASIRSEVLDPSPQPSGAATPIMAMAVLHAEHAVSCPHDTSECGICHVSITCCECHLMYTAPAAKRMRCTKCLHWACDLDRSTNCCKCDTPWIPLELISSPRIATENKPATRFRGSAGSDNESESSSTHMAQGDSTVKIQVTAPTQESLDEIDALSRPSTVKPAKEKGKPRTRHQPRSGQSSREPSRPSSVASDRLSVTETVLHKPDYDVPPLAHEYIWSSPPTDIRTLPGYVYEAHQEKTLHVDDEDVTHFVKRGDIDINESKGNEIISSWRISKD
ncbi:hypothetical protein AX14_007348 [Amanita brunnescens Koide BX004]|nr:hypothetical protein AX14_007348 [Amanita brunnescens Koide BX004]